VTPASHHQFGFPLGECDVTPRMSASPDAPVELVPYSSAWPAAFAEEAARLQVLLAPWLVGRVEHIGSTAVPGLSAKAVIDIMAPVASLQESLGAIGPAQGAGYVYYPYKPEIMHWFCKPSPALRTHHLQLVPIGSALWSARLGFRNALRQSPELAAQYSQLKADLARRHPDDREAYTEGKSEFIETALRQHRGAP